MSAFSKLQAYMFISLLARDFTKWKAYELGIIDEKGKRIKDPSTKEEKDSLDVFENLVRKIKVLISRFAPNSKYLAFITAAWLLKKEDNQVYKSFNQQLEIELNQEEKELLEELLYSTS